MAKFGPLTNAESALQTRMQTVEKNPCCRYISYRLYGKQGKSDGFDTVIGQVDQI